jgi:transposase
MASIPETTIGIDLGKKYSWYCVLSSDGELVSEGRVPTTKRAFETQFCAGRPRGRIAIEVGAQSRWVRELLEAAGHEVLVANARKLRMIFQNESKSDRLDAASLARVARLDPRLLYPVEHRRAEIQADLAVTRARLVLVETRTRMVLHVRGVLRAEGVEVGKSSPESFPSKAVGILPERLHAALMPILRILQDVTEQIKQYDRQIERLCKERYPETSLLTAIPGVGSLTALCFVLTLADPRRFRRSRDVGAYLGLRPRKAQSGDRDPQLRITKTGDPEVRRLLVQSAHWILGWRGPDCELRRWGEKLAGRGGKAAKKRAVIAVARKLAVLLHRLWIASEVYDPFHGESQRRQAA